MPYYNEKIETMPKEELAKLQYQELKKLVTRLYDSSVFYHTKMAESGVKPADITSITDITKLPFMKKTDLRDNYPDGLVCVPHDDLVRYHVSSGTTGKPTVVAYTQNDIDLWSECVARSLVSCGIGKKDVLQVCYGYGLFTGGLGLHYGGEKVGATVIPASTGNSERQIELIQDLKTTAIACTPSYFIHLIDVAKKMGVDFSKDTLLRTAVLGAEPWTDAMRRYIYAESGVTAHNIFGTSEISGPMFTDCSELNGMHICGDIAYTEIIDPKTGEQLPPGEKGELTITVLKKEAIPMIRYRIGDITSILEGDCACGRTSPRIDRLQGRVDDMLIIRGINVFPSAIEHALLKNPYLTSHFMIEVFRTGPLDDMLVKVELKPDAMTDSINGLMEMQMRTERALRDALNVSAKIELCPPNSLPRFEGKAKRVIDHRVI
ncbi:phenylacetate--CoA ligase family protein [Methanocorpusculum sp. GPch4]|uniref:phenylacetate--CoA ligase family protein n=1 Tax=Methanocorpusculum sp. GPch4 TaxID=2527877 RepID=UPI001432C7BD|nr:phenylacetate--CoA ligase [Methanocorpusculum sp. GPch4]